jgi:hypothetical protein
MSAYLSNQTNAMEKSTYKITKTGTGVLLTVNNGANRFVVTDDRIRESVSTGRLVVRYVVPGISDSIHGVCVLCGDEVVRAADRWMNDEHDHAMMILLPVMVDSVGRSLDAVTCSWKKLGVPTIGLYKYLLN